MNSRPNIPDQEPAHSEFNEMLHSDDWSGGRTTSIYDPVMHDNLWSEIESLKKFCAETRGSGSGNDNVGSESGLL